jgi:hypothetical protein
MQCRSGKEGGKSSLVQRDDRVGYDWMRLTPGAVAQWKEQRPTKPRVRGSSPFRATVQRDGVTPALMDHKCWVRPTRDLAPAREPLELSGGRNTNNAPQVRHPAVCILCVIE